MEHKDKLPPIPTPVSQRWREFRIRFLPFIVFVGLIAGIVVLWRGFVQPSGIVGFAETNAVNVVASQDGLLSTLTVERFQMVTKGQEIGVVINTDPELLKAQIAVAQADIEVLRSRNMVDQDRTEQSYQQFRQDLLNHRVAQATARVNWIVASNTFRRTAELFKAGQESPAKYDADKGSMDAISATIEERERQIDDLSRSLAEIITRRKANPTDAFDKAIEAKQRELELLLKPNSVRAPIAGMVSMVHHSGGERVLRGMPIVTITDPEAIHVIGYIRQPIVNKPLTNAVVQITTRSQPRIIAVGHVVHVGAQLEPINPALLSVDTKRMEVGLPILINFPQGVRLTPGEFVDIAIQAPKK